MQEIERTKQLLNNVIQIIEHHKEIAKIKGEDFNIFSILRMETKEVKTHSRFLAELLNPKGKHYFGIKFLELFLVEIGHSSKDKATKPRKDFVASNKTKVFVEHHIDTVNLAKGIGGNIDIYIEDERNNAISIENKIYAEDQKQQVLRYSNYNKAKNTVYYLTLFGNEPSEKSITNSKNIKLTLGEDFYIISYKTHILNWLEKCLKEAAEQPILRETIKQYIIVIKKLTNTLNMEQEEKMNSLILDNLESAIVIKNKLDTVKERLKEKFNKQIKELANSLGMISNEDFTIAPKNWKNHVICFSFEESGVIFGIKRDKDDFTKPTIPEIKNRFSDFTKTTKLWPLYKNYYKNINKDEFEFWLDVKNDKALEKAKLFIETMNNDFNTDKY